MPLKTAEQLIEQEVKEHRKELLKDVAKRGELKANGFEDYEIDEMIQEEKDEVERDVAEYRAELMAELPQRETELAEERICIFELAAFNNLWLPHCLMPVEGEGSTLVTKEAYEHYLAWCEAIGISEPYSLVKVRSSLKDHDGIENIRTGLRAYRLAEVSTKVNHDQLIARYETDSRKQERESEKLRDLTCPHCERRKYNGNRFDRCYWCNRILKDGYDLALADYMAEGYDRTGASMHLAYQRMLSAGEVEAPAYKAPTPTPTPSVIRGKPINPRTLSTSKPSRSKRKPEAKELPNDDHKTIPWKGLAVVFIIAFLIVMCARAV